MIEIILYTLLELTNFYLAYRCVFGIRFTIKRWPYVTVIMSAFLVQAAVLYLVDHTWRDVIACGMGLFGAILLTSGKKWKTILLYPIVFCGTCFVNVLGSYGVAMLLRVSPKNVVESWQLTMVSECTAIIVVIIYALIIKKKSYEEFSLTAGQYLVMLIGVICFFILIVFSQGLLQEEILFVNKMRDIVAVACVIIALFFLILCIWQQNVWRKMLQYEVFLAGQEEYIRMTIFEDEKRRKLRHDMNAHMIALDTMVEKEEWEMLREYLGQMKESVGEISISRYTGISAVDSIVDEWHRKALEYDVKWSWKGTLGTTDKVSVFELCTIFSNLLSNAVEANERIEEDRRLEVMISNFQNQIVISIGNTYETVSTHQGKLVTSKHDKVFHGLGLTNVEEIVKKQGGSIDYNVKSGWFQVDIVL